MRLTLVDRRGAVAEPDPWRGVAWPQLAALAAAIGPADWSLDLVLLADEAMADLNERWRGQEGPTDVLSFSYLAAAGRGDPDLATGTADAARDLWLADEVRAAGRGAPLAGELLLAPAFVLARCRERGWHPDHEWPLLVVHGCLHVLGWEHDDEVRRRAMEDREAALLAAQDLPHPLRERS